MKKIIFGIVALLLIAGSAIASDYQVPVGNTVTAVTANTPKQIPGSTTKFTYFKVWAYDTAFNAHDVLVYLGNSVTASAIHVPVAQQPFEYSGYSADLVSRGVVVSVTYTSNVYFLSTRNHDMD